jgi:peptide/nickel transport system permease protein
MPRFIITRLASAAVVLLGLVFVVFVLQQVSPLDPVKAMVGANASQAAVQEQREALGLDDPLSAQFLQYVENLAHGDLGTSYRTRRPVSSDLSTYLPATAELAAAALLMALALAGILAFSVSLRWKGASVLKGVMLAGASAPPFLLALGAILLFYSKLGWLPATGRSDFTDAPTGPTGFLTIDGLIAGRPEVTVDAVQHLILPALAIALGAAIAIGRVLNSSIDAEQGSDYARTARAKGLSDNLVLRRHVLRNAAGPSMSMAGLQVGLMFAGVLVIEQIFAWPGVGLYMAQSIPVADFPAIAGVTLALGVAYVLINALVDVLQAWADPRLET